jgi:hypothetical protein
MAEEMRMRRKEIHPGTFDALKDDAPKAVRA